MGSEFRLVRIFSGRAGSRPPKGQAAQVGGCDLRDRKAYYEKWSDEIKRGLESKLVPNIEESIKRLGKKRKARLRTGQVPPRTGSKR